VTRTHNWMRYRRYLGPVGHSGSWCRVCVSTAGGRKGAGRVPDVRGGFRGLDGDGTSQVCDVLCVRCSAGSTLTCAGRCLLAGSREQRALPLHRERRQPSGAGCVC
jgi:hypothetical protein